MSRHGWDSNPNRFLWLLRAYFIIVWIGAILWGIYQWLTK